MKALRQVIFDKSFCSLSISGVGLRGYLTKSFTPSVVVWGCYEPLQQFHVSASGSRSKRAKGVDDTEKRKAASPHFTPSVFHDELYEKFVNCMMWDGQKSVSQSILKDTFEEIKVIRLKERRNSADGEYVEVNPSIIFKEGIENCKPVLGLQTLRRGGKSYKVPSPIPESRRRFQAIRWILDVCRAKGPKEIKMYEKLAKELIDASQNQGAAHRKKQDYHKTVEANRAFAHFRWW